MRQRSQLGLERDHSWSECCGAAGSRVSASRGSGAGLVLPKDLLCQLQQLRVSSRYGIIKVG